MSRLGHLSIEKFTEIATKALKSAKFDKRSHGGVSYDDVIQDVCLRLFGSQNFLRLDESQQIGYVFNSIKNECASIHRKNPAQKFAPFNTTDILDQSRQLSDLLNEDGEILRNGSKTIIEQNEDKFISQQDYRRLTDQVEATLPKELANVYRALINANMDKEKVAKELGKSIKTISTALSLIRKHKKTFEALKEGSFSEADHPLSFYWQQTEQDLQKSNCSQLHEINILIGFCSSFHCLLQKSFWARSAVKLMKSVCEIALILSLRTARKSFLPMG